MEYMHIQAELEQQRRLIEEQARVIALNQSKNQTDSNSSMVVASAVTLEIPADCVPVKKLPQVTSYKDVPQNLPKPLGGNQSSGHVTVSTARGEEERLATSKKELKKDPRVVEETSSMGARAAVDLEPDWKDPQIMSSTRPIPVPNSSEAHLRPTTSDGGLSRQLLNVISDEQPLHYSNEFSPPVVQTTVPSRETNQYVAKVYEGNPSGDYE